ncbi:T9SS type B sorting domain-containing protein [Dokdonia sp. PRO95]|uniref:T9SS type B sorting domain-containing protein n=1 Tax=Dokdonia sp. PRO95 TaxID=1239415 RepID=UPI000A7CDA9D|nr:T9SS type B sorting domain-containing protein [Dokdonia sp. PRO95]
MNSNLHFKLLLLICISVVFKSNSQITLSHNVGSTPVETDMTSCERDESWSRIFKLSDFGIAASEQFIITSGQVGLSKSSTGAYLEFNIYSIDGDFPYYPYSVYPTTHLGGYGLGQSPEINGTPEIIETDFDRPIIVPAGTERILVTVSKTDDFYNEESGEVFIAGTEQDTGVSWYWGCDDNGYITPTTDLITPVDDANFYINVTGNVIDVNSRGTITRLSHNACDDIVETNIHSCTSSDIYWSRAFTLEEFGISTNEEFTINSGQVGITKSSYQPELNFRIYKIDNNFPSSFSESDLIGSSQYQQISPNIGDNPQIINIAFDTPVVIPPNVERILVEVHKGITYGSALAFIAGSTQDNDVSWQRGCTRNVNTINGFATATQIGAPDANFYINVTGEVNNIYNDFEMNVSNICAEFVKEFSLEGNSTITSVLWDFGDVASGDSKTSSELSPFHDFSADGIYTVTATITTTSGSSEVITETISVTEPPQAYGISNITQCEDMEGTGISSFDVSNITNQVLGGQQDKTVTFIDGVGNEYDVLPNPFTNTVSNLETITVRVAHNNNLCCYSETSFDLITTPLPILENISDITNCENATQGYSDFDLSMIATDISQNQPNSTIQFFNGNGVELQEPLPNPYSNSTPWQEIITIKATNNQTGCSNETTFNLNVAANPIANDIEILTGCDDNEDGISEYFDTSNVESQVMGDQSGMQVSYYDTAGALLPYPLPNPFTNTEPDIQDIIVRVTDPSTDCYSETILTLETSQQPVINELDSLFACNQTDGFSQFDTSQIENTLLGNQTGLIVTYWDNSGNALPSPLPNPYLNTVAFNQTINVKVENELNPLCYSETSFNLIINELPEIQLEEEYFICNSENSLSLNVEAGFESYLWLYEDGTTISNTRTANISTEGNYTVIVAQMENGISCENYFDFTLIRSALPEIQEVRYGELGNNFIEIITSSVGDFEYSIDGIDFQNSNYFSDVSGGIYNVQVRDKEGCGKDSKKITVVDYPKFFTPNNDGYHDFWHIYGITNYPSAKIHIYDRFGKLLKQLSPSEQGWNGIYRGQKMPSSDYWFSVDLGQGTLFSGHFTLKR